MKINLADLPRIASREFLGGTVQSLAADGSEACVRFLPPEGMTNPHGTMQGGFVAAMIDDVVSMATWFAGGERTFVTSSLNCYYLRPVPMGTPLLVNCQLVRVGQRQAVFEASVSVEGNTPGASSDSTLVKGIQIQQFL